ncbi:MAG: hypothetical protein Kapaf2KO_09580 [Candidatus Kapaibacteriales bacterium]
MSEADRQTATYLTMIADGRLQDVKAKLPDLMVERPNDPGVQLLLGVVIDDAFKALDIYKKITETYPDSEWADDAYWRIVQFYAVMGDTTQAKNELTSFRRKYPTSGYLVPAIDVVRSSIAMTKAQIKPVVEGPLMTPSLAMANKLEPLPSLKTEKKIEKVIEVAEAPKQNSTTITNKNENLELEPISKAPKLMTNTELAVKEVPEKKSVAVEPQKKEKLESIEKVEDSAENDRPDTEFLASTLDTPDSIEKETPRTGFFGLQVASYEESTSAENTKNDYIQKRMRTEIIKRKDSNGRMLNQVVIGNYSSKSSAEAAKIIVARQCGCDPVIVEK